MSVIRLCREGDPIRCVEEFHAPPVGMPFHGEMSENRCFEAGERVTYAGYYADYEDAEPGGGWMVIFAADDGVEYEALQTYFISENAWRELKGKLHAYERAAHHPQAGHPAAA